MTDVATNLSTINGSLSDIKTAIVNKGVTPSGNITTYATAIGSIPSGGVQPIVLTRNEFNLTYTGSENISSIQKIVIFPYTDGTPVYPHYYIPSTALLLDSGNAQVTKIAGDTLYLDGAYYKSNTDWSFEFVISYYDENNVITITPLS